MNPLNYVEKLFFFTDKLDNNIKKKINKFKNLSIVYKSENNKSNINEFLEIKNFCKKKNIKIYFPDNIQIAIKLGANGLFISSKNNKIYPKYKQSFKIIGSVHSQRELYFKLVQKCDLIFFSPIFNNSKYSSHKILGLIKYNLISLNWKINLLALGGINQSNFKKIALTRSLGIGMQSWMKNQ